MAAQFIIKNIFLSASVPKPGRVYYGTADPIAIRDSVIALASAVISRPNYHLIWGGHPSITPLIALVLNRYGLTMSNRVTLYQSAYHRRHFPPENEDIGNRIVTEDLGNEVSSMRLMREKMLGDNNFAAAVFVGGMEGVIEEYDMINHYHPNIPCFPVASTGAAAKALFNLHPGAFDNRLESELSYTTLFKELLGL